MGVAFGSEEMVKNGRRDSYPFAIMPLADRNLDEVVKKRSSPSSFDFLKYWMSPESMNSAIGNDDAITKASDVFQLAALFWFAATKRHPTGIVKANDWCGPLEIFKVLVSRFHMIHNLGQKTGANLTRESRWLFFDDSRTNQMLPCLWYNFPRGIKMQSEEIKRLVAKSENAVVEFKLARGGVPADFWPSYSAFANTDGGVIILGVRENDGKREIEGLQVKEKIAVSDDEQGIYEQLLKGNDK